MTPADESRTTDLLLALSHPLRREILRRLGDDEPRTGLVSTSVITPASANTLKW